jgi:porin
VRPTAALTGLLGVFNSSPAGLGTGDPQRRDPSGTNFDLNNGVFVIGEVQYAINQGDGATGLPGTYKRGAWYNSNTSTYQFSTVSPITARSPRLCREPFLAGAGLMCRKEWEGPKRHA